MNKKPQKQPNKSPAPAKIGRVMWATSSKNHHPMLADEYLILSGSAKGLKDTHRLLLLDLSDEARVVECMALAQINHRRRHAGSTAIACTSLHHLQEARAVLKALKGESKL